MTARLLAWLLICLTSPLMATENAPVSAGSVQVELDPAKSAVHFTLGAVLHTVHGTFRVKSGNVRFDPASGQASGQIAVDVKSAKTGDNARDRQMHESVLESERFPEAIFSPDHVTGRLASSGESALEVHGSLSLHGSEHSMTIPVRVKIENGLVTATAKFAVPYVAWGMKDPSNLVLRVDKTVEVEVTLAGSRQEK
jgi:polyisoprenoid-binding protein YceI